MWNLFIVNNKETKKKSGFLMFSGRSKSIYRLTALKAIIIPLLLENSLNAFLEKAYVEKIRPGKRTFILFAKNLVLTFNPESWQKFWANNNTWMRLTTCGMEKRAGPTSMTLASLCAVLIGALNALTYMKIYIIDLHKQIIQSQLKKQ